MPKLFSYVVDHDYGYAPCPSGDFGTLAKCKYGTTKCKNGTRRNIVELAEEGDWIAGTGGVDLGKSAGHGKLRPQQSLVPQGAPDQQRGEGSGRQTAKGTFSGDEESVRRLRRPRLDSAKSTPMGRTWVRGEGGGVCDRVGLKERRKPMKPGDFINIPAHKKHRVEWTTPDEPTVWLGVRYGEVAPICGGNPL